MRQEKAASFYLSFQPPTTHPHSSGQEIICRNCCKLQQIRCCRSYAKDNRGWCWLLQPMSVQLVEGLLASAKRDVLPAAAAETSERTFWTSKVLSTVKMRSTHVSRRFYSFTVQWFKTLPTTAGFVAESRYRAHRCALTNTSLRPCSTISCSIAPITQQQTDFMPPTSA